MKLFILRAAAASVAAVIFAIAGVSSAQAATAQDGVSSAVNSQRAAAGLSPLKRDATLDAAAQAWAQNMSNAGAMTHSTSDWRSARIPAGWNSQGENVAYGYSSAASVMSGWMNSPGHRENILRSSFTRIGVGYVASGNFWVQIFAGYSSDALAKLSPTPVPTIAGTPRVGQAITANAGTWGPSGVTLAYQWQANGTVISGATTSSFIPRAIDVGSRITVAVSGSRAGYFTSVRTSASSAVVVTNLAVSRIAGADRFASANAMSQKAFPGTANVVYVASGMNYPDALSAAPAAIKQNAPLLLTDPSVLTGSVQNEIRRLAPATIVVAGGPGVVSNTVFASLKKLAPKVVRVAGDDRYATSRAIADFAFGSAGSATAYVSNGSDFPDALSAGSAAGSIGAPTLLVNGVSSTVDKATLAVTDDLGVASTRITGGAGSVSDGIARSLTSSGVSVARFGGADRFATSIAINANAYSRSSIAYLSTGYNFPDALAGAVLAGKQRAPLFVVPSTCVPRGVLAEFARLGTTQVVLLGGPGSLASSVNALVPCAS